MPELLDTTSTPTDVAEALAKAAAIVRATEPTQYGKTNTLKGQDFNWREGCRRSAKQIEALIPSRPEPLPMPTGARLALCVECDPDELPAVLAWLAANASRDPKIHTIKAAHYRTRYLLDTEGDNGFRQKLVKFLNSFADCDDEGA